MPAHRHRDAAQAALPRVYQSALAAAGRISFLEFLLCLEGWVIDAEDDEDILAS
jgi:hypothetical protein